MRLCNARHCRVRIDLGVSSLALLTYLLGYTVNVHLISHPAIWSDNENPASN